jgi:hypothetical protein
MSTGKGWTVLGHFDPKVRTSAFAMVYSVMIAGLTFDKGGHRYKVLMCYLILIAGAYIAKKAIDASSILGVCTALFSLIWVLPILDKTVFYTVNLPYLIAHSILAMAVAVGAFSYFKN